MDIYELLNAIISDEKIVLSSRLFTDVDKEKLDENAKPLYDLVNRSFLGRSTLSAGLTSMRSVLTAYLSALWMIAW